MYELDSSLGPKERLGESGVSLTLAQAESRVERTWSELGPRLNRSWAERAPKVRLEEPIRAWDELGQSLGQI